jgi:hypothetical protein
MTSLFDSIAARFAAPTAPAITPRPRVRFEHETNDDTVIEDYTEQVAPQPSLRPQPAVERNFQPPQASEQATRHKTDDPVPQGYKAPPPAIPAPPAQPRVIQPSQGTKPQAPTPNAPTFEHPPDQTKIRPKPATDPSEVAAQNPSDKADAAHSHTAPINVHHMDHHTEIITRQTSHEHARTPNAQRQNDQPAPIIDPPQATVKIGRIAVSRPAAPAPPRAAAPPTPPRNTSHTSKSTLTTYLGWKS